MCSKIGAAQVAAASTCTGLSEPRWLPAEDVSGENLTVWEAGVRQRGSTSEITNVPRSRVRQSGSRRSLPLCRPSATQSRLPGKMLLSQKINTRSDAGPHRKSDCERATQRMRGGELLCCGQVCRLCVLALGMHVYMSHAYMYTCRIYYAGAACAFHRVVSLRRSFLSKTSTRSSLPLASLRSSPSARRPSTSNR